MSVDRQTVDLSEYPDLVVVYLGMRVRRWRGAADPIGATPPVVGSVPERCWRHWLLA